MITNEQTNLSKNKNEIKQIFFENSTPHKLHQVYTDLIKENDTSVQRRIHTFP